jgi:muramidase (phage lysozyme)
MEEGTKSMSDTLFYASKSMSPQQLAGLQSVFATGAIVGEDAAVLARSIPNITELVAKVKEGSMAPEAFMMQIQKSTGNMIDLVGDAGKLSAETAKAFGLSVESIRFYNEMQSRIAAAGSEEEALAQMLKERKDATVDAENKKDALMNAETKRLEAEREARLKRSKALEEAVVKLGVFEALGKVFETVTLVMNEFEKVIKGIIDWVHDKASWMFSGSDTPPTTESIPAHDAGGSIGVGQLGLVGEIGPELVTGPMQVTGRQQTADILQQAMQDYGQQQFQDLRNFVASSPAMAGGKKSQQLTIDRQLQDIREEQENQYDYLLNFNDVTLNLTDAFDHLYDTVHEVEDQLRSIFGTEDKASTMGDLVYDNSVARTVIDGVKDFFGMRTAPSTAPPAPSTPLPPGVTGLLEQISRGEGTSDEQAKAKGFKSGYDVTLGYGKFGGPTSKPITEMTLAEVKAYQNKMLADPKNSLNSSAVGKYQFIQTTLNDLQRQLGLKDDITFDAKTQDMLAKELLKRRGAERFLSGKMSAEHFQRNLSKEWASIAEDYRNRSYYGQHVGTTSGQIQTALSDFGTMTPASTKASPTSYVLRSSQNATPTVGTVVAALNSKEEPVESKSTYPAPTPVVATTTATTDSGQLLSLNAKMMGDLNDKLTSMISKIEESNSIMEKIRVNTA